MLRIVRPTPDDWQTFRELRLAALQESPRSFGSSYASERAQPEGWWRDWIGSPETADAKAIFIAYADETPAGLVGAFRMEAGTVHLVAMWVAPDARRQGIGRALTHAVLDWAGEVGAPSVTLDVAEDNKPAAQMFATLGFRPTGQQRPLESDPSRLSLEMERLISR